MITIKGRILDDVTDLSGDSRLAVEAPRLNTDRGFDSFNMGLRTVTDPTFDSPAPLIFDTRHMRAPQILSFSDKHFGIPLSDLVDGIPEFILSRISNVVDAGELGGLGGCGGLGRFRRHDLFFYSAQNP